MSMKMSLLKGLPVYTLLSLFVAACSSDDNGEYEDSGSGDNIYGSNRAKSSRIYRDENYDNLPRTDIGDTLYFYDEDPSKNDSSLSEKYEPGPNDIPDTTFIEGNEFSDNQNSSDYSNTELIDGNDFTIDSAYVSKIDAARQSEIAKELFIRLTSSPDVKSQKKIYSEIILKCPDTHEAQLAYYKLANIMMFEGSEPDYRGVIKLLRDYHLRYPESSRLSSILPFLLRAYEELNMWDKLAEVYSYVFRNNPDALKKDIIKHYYKFAQSLERTKRKEEAIVWYKKALEKYDGKDNNIFINLSRTRLIDLEGSRNN